MAYCTLHSDEHISLQLNKYTPCPSWKCKSVSPLQDIVHLFSGHQCVYNVKRNVLIMFFINEGHSISMYNKILYLNELRLYYIFKRNAYVTILLEATFEKTRIILWYAR